MVEIRIGLPLPIDITGTLINIIGLTWPGTAVKNSHAKWRHEEQLVLEIPDADRHKSPKEAQRYAAVKQHLDAEADACITALGPAGVSVGVPEHLARVLVTLAKSWFEHYPDAENYLESTVYDPDSRQRFVFYVAKSKGQTPHELRLAAELDRSRASDADDIGRGCPHGHEAQREYHALNDDHLRCGTDDDDLRLQTERPCAKCGDKALTLSSRDWCDGCEEEAEQR
jgi:hypothetical protein